MTEPTTPDEWSETAEAVPGADQAYVYSVGEDARVLVRLASPSGGADETRLEVSSIEETGVVKRHDFIVATFSEEQASVEAMTSFMQFVVETLPPEDMQDERLFVAVQRCIEEFDSAVHETGPSLDDTMNRKRAEQTDDGEQYD